MTTAAPLPVAQPRVEAPLRRPARTWLFGGWIDLLFIANIAWPTVLLFSWWGGTESQSMVLFWQVYFVTTPHRWVTLALVFCDGRRFRERSGTFLGLAVGVSLLCLGMQLSTGALTCLLAVDYIWNAWHFASQHHGIYRIYSRISQPDYAPANLLEKWPLRILILYIAFRTATWAMYGPDSVAWIEPADWIALAIPAGLLMREVPGIDRYAVGRIGYLLSMLLLYTGLLLSIRANRPVLVLLLTTASALFHAIEYMAIVSWSVRSRHGEKKEETFFGRLLPRWGLVLLIYMTILGVGGWLMNEHLLRIWLTLNVIIAFLHYSYDGLIWKSRPKRAPEG